jgi:4-alpha-glucanotransferase
LRRRFAPVPWEDWPSPWSDPTLARLREFRRFETRECEFHEYVQWIADQQLAHCNAVARQHGLPVGLYLDLAVGIDPQGADAWSNQAAVLSDFSIGAPPDQFNPAGQDWGLAPLNPHALPDNDFAMVRALLSAAMKHAGAVRLDHVLSLMRLFLIPRGEGPARGTYVRFPFEPLLKIIAQESNHYRCVFIGEDLGTVPGGFREVAARWGIWSYRVMLFERHGAGEFNRPQDYPAEALAAFNTHDLPTFRGWMSGHDLAVKHAIGVDPGESRGERERSRVALRSALAAHAGGYEPDSFPAVAAYLGATPSRLVIVAVEDLLDVADQVNIPATTDQYPNWRRKLPLPLEDWERHPTWRAAALALRASGR